MKPIEQLMRTAPVIPVLVIEDAADAVPMAQALVAGGLRVLEVTLRTPAALDAIRSAEGDLAAVGRIAAVSYADADAIAVTDIELAPQEA